ncbi:MAG: transcriptional repressor [Butyrivibrio sp.]|nr:transcriptional repressor [Butyrivibrio sp.]
MSRSYSTVSHTKIMKYLSENTDKSVTVGDIEDYLREQGLEVNVSTIYRFLNRLNDSGELIKYAAGKGEMSAFQYIGDRRPQSCLEHLHLHCVECGRIIHLECSFMREISEHIMEHHGFALKCEASVLYGVCDECRG